MEHKGPMATVDDPSRVLDALYKAESARLLAVLVRLFGPQHLELAEDVLQDAFQRALLNWQSTGIPENPAGWMITAARNRAIDVIRSRRVQERFAEDLRHQLESDWTLSYTVDREFSEAQIRDDQLRMIFMCASAEISPENRIPLILRTLCGFSIPAIARALFVSEETVKKRLVRTRERLRGHHFEWPAVDRLLPAMDSVHTVIYLLFNEGFHSPDEATPLRRDLCLKAVHLGALLAQEPRIVNRDTLGLMALMRFHLARVTARVDPAGENVPIDLQDRALWDHDEIERGGQLLQLASYLIPGASGRFFIEAAITHEHCRAHRFADTNWRAIVLLYDELVQATDSPIAHLNQAVALAYAGEIDAAVARVQAASQHPILQGSHLPSATLAHLHALRGEAERARHYAHQSTSLGGSPREQSSMHQQIERMLRSATG